MIFDFLSLNEKTRYSRHLKLQHFTVKKQLKLKNSKVLVVGAGGLASSLLVYLSACGIGSIDVMDFDNVEDSNLQRQIIHKEYSLGINKALSAKTQMQTLNSFIKVEAKPVPFNEDNCHLIKHYHIVAVTVDDYFTRSLINKVAVQYNVPQVVAGVVGYFGWLTTFKNYNNSPCYNCFHHNLSTKNIKKAKDIGVFSPLVGTLGVMQSGEIIRELLNFPNSLEKKIRTIEYFYNTLNEIKLTKKPSCLVCNSPKEYT